MNTFIKLSVVAIVLIVLIAGITTYVLYPTNTELIGKKTKIDVGTLAITKKDAEYLQLVEHLGGFVFGDKTLPKVSQALKKGDAESLASFLAPGFTGKVFVDGGHLRTRPFATMRSWKKDTAKLGELTAQEFVKALGDMRNEFSELHICAVKAMQMQPDKHGDLEGGWNGTLKVILAGKLAKGGVGRRIAKFEVALSELKDDLPEKKAWLKSCHCYQQQFAQAKDFLLKDMTAETGIHVKKLHDNWQLAEDAHRPALTGGMYMCDYNHDGWMDMLVTDLNGLFFYQGQPGGKFRRVNKEVGIPLRTLVQDKGAVFADFDGDGFEDLILGNKIYKNDNGKKFIELSVDQHSLYLDPGTSKFAVADYDGDGRLDLYVIGISGSKTLRNWIGKNNSSQNQLWRNLGNFKFTDVTRKTKTVGNGSAVFAAIWFDANQDGLPDLMTACEFGTNDYFLNTKSGVFKQGITPKGYGGFSMGITFSDIDNDGRGDPYIANMYSKAGERIVGNMRLGLYKPEIDDKLRDFVSGNDLLHNQGGTFKRIGRSSGVSDVGWAYGVGFVDLDNDGLPEPYAPVGYQSVTPTKPDG